MKAAFISQPGPPDSIQIGNLPTPEIDNEQVLISVKAASVNPIDTYIRSGVIEMPLPDPFIPGCDAAGVVEAIGSDVKRFSVGDRVWTTNQGLLGRQGTFAEQIAVDEKWTFALPDEVDFETAAACGLVGVTA